MSHGRVSRAGALPGLLDALRKQGRSIAAGTDSCVPRPKWTNRGCLELLVGPFVGCVGTWTGWARERESPYCAASLSLRVRGDQLSFNGCGFSGVWCLRSAPAGGTPAAREAPGVGVVDEVPENKGVRPARRQGVGSLDLMTVTWAQSPIPHLLCVHGPQYSHPGNGLWSTEGVSGQR